MEQNLLELKEKAANLVQACDSFQNYELVYRCYQCWRNSPELCANPAYLAYAAVLEFQHACAAANVDPDSVPGDSLPVVPEPVKSRPDGPMTDEEAARLLFESFL